MVANLRIPAAPYLRMSTEHQHYSLESKSAGVPVHYCAKTFANDGSLPSLVMKALRRTMAGESDLPVTNNGVYQEESELNLNQECSQQGSCPRMNARV